MSSSVRIASVVALLWLALPADVARAEPVRGPARQPSDPAAPISVPWRAAGNLGLWTLLVIASGAAIVVLRARWLSRRAGPSGGGAIEVLGRLALTPRHFVWLLRVGDRQVLVGAAGDRIEPLAVLEPPAAGPRAPARLRPEPLVPERSAEPSGRSVTDNDLVPYRRQVDRLKEILRRGSLTGKEEGEVQ